MKKQFLIVAALMVASAASFAQTGQSLYNFDNTGTAREVNRLGAAPEFPFLRNKKTAREVYAALKKHANDNTAAMRQLNELLMQEGYTNGVADLQPDDITMAWLPVGTEGNMGSRGYVYNYTRLEGDSKEFKAWKIEPKGSAQGPMYFFAKCGNAFYPKTQRTACINVPVSVTPDMNQITVPASGTKAETNNKTFVFYKRKHARRHQNAGMAMAGVDPRYASKPILVDNTWTGAIMPETYTVSVAGNDKSVTACPDSTLNLTANIDVEKTSSYTGNYPDKDNKTYKQVSKREYKMIARRMRRIHRKEDKIARRTGVTVDVKTQAS